MTSREEDWYVAWIRSSSSAGRAMLEDRSDAGWPRGRGLPKRRWTPQATPSLRITASVRGAEIEIDEGGDVLVRPDPA